MSLNIRQQLDTKKTIYIVRHAQTDYNRQGIIQGSGIDSDINEFGEMQAASFHRWYEYHKFKRIYISELKRTRQSVLPYIERGFPIEVMPELNEISWGVFEGKEQTPELKKAFEYTINRWRDGFLDEPIEGGESPMDLYLRQREGIRKIMERTDEDLILICTHGRAMRSLISILMDTPLRDMDDYDHYNMSLYVIDMVGMKAKMRINNQTAHAFEAG